MESFKELFNGWDAVDVLNGADLSLTISFFGTIICCLITSTGNLVQGISIWRENSCASVSNKMYIGWAGAYVPGILYGFYGKKSALIFACIMGLLSITPTLIGLAVKRGFVYKEKVLILCLTIFPLIMIYESSSMGLLYMLSAIIFIICICDQANEIYQKKETGVVSVAMLVTNFMGIVFWAIYSYATQAWLIGIITTLNLLVFLVTTIFWFIYRNNQSNGIVPNI